ncbi:MAG: 2-oxoglutarate dehydrogenase complex dihydrolipoyllysine-residue succinyltransferase [Alphaproteobacteria bacterium]|jgi:2-oxoglutarate dehydrogenase E2 component (dihydrolipoamide succinyltransferase)|nr:2-oxoglutarate dehydrogenase complex dihydrolipoyllysine-residue succinyltransferase [Alphaproteobacteria bacterium]
MKILVPSLGESITEATVAKWLKKKGDIVSKDEVLLELETDKATLEVYAQSDGTLSEIYFEAGQDVEIGAELADFIKGKNKNISKDDKQENSEVKDDKNNEVEVKEVEEKIITPEIVSSIEVKRSGAGNKITKNDLQEFIGGKNLSPSQRRKDIFDKQDNVVDSISGKIPLSTNKSSRVPMTRLQRTMAERLKSSQNTAAMLTTFNEVDMSKVIEIRNRNKDNFERKYNVKLGFMSFFCNAVSLALKEIPIINSEIDGNDIIYHNHIDIGIALSAPQGLLVPVIRNVDLKPFSEIEQKIYDFGVEAKNSSITTAQMSGATFTITNGGIYGSMMSTPILNPPQNGILGLHQIKDRAIVENGEIKIKPMMYIALTYDHRAISGKEAVSFLVKVKEFIEKPERMLIGS